jgi:hypothetical protein
MLELWHRMFIDQACPLEVPASDAPIDSACDARSVVAGGDSL